MARLTDAFLGALNLTTSTSQGIAIAKSYEMVMIVVAIAMPVAIPLMLAYALSLGIACGYLIMKTGSLWGATLIHAAADLFLFIAMLANA